MGADDGRLALAHAHAHTRAVPDEAAVIIQVHVAVRQHQHLVRPARLQHHILHLRMQQPISQLTSSGKLQFVELARTWQDNTSAMH